MQHSAHLSTARAAPARGTAGFTLIELMITVAVAAILTTIATESYQNSVRKARRTEAKTALLDLAGREERYYSLNNQYTNVAANLGYTGFGGGTSVGGGYYRLNAPNIVNATATTPASYTLQAVPIGTQTQDTSCQSFTVNSAGQQSALNSANADSTATCW